MSVWLALAAAAVAAIRLHQCAQLPVETGDVVRHLLYGNAVRRIGLDAARESLVAIDPEWAYVSWARLPYNYPPVTLAFFTIVSALSPTVFAAKLALSGLEALNAWLAARVTGSRALGLIYWASPASVWWVSREGQFEPLQNAFTLLALWLAPSRPLAAGAALALAIQVKMTAAALVPWLGFVAWRGGRPACVRAVAGLALGLVPALAVELAWGGISNVLRHSSPLVYNPYYWNWQANMFSWNPGWLIACDELASYGMLAALLVLALRSATPLVFAAPIAFVLFCKVHTNVQFWYWLVLPALLVPVPRLEGRLALIAACVLLDVRAALELPFGPFAQRGFHGLPSVFASYRPPR